MLDDISYNEEFVRDNDYSISQVRKGQGHESGITLNSRITRTFNFLSAQVTTITRDITHQPGGYKTGGSSSVATTITMQNFDDFQSAAEIRLMHEKLTALDGHPPPLDGILQESGKKPLRLPSPGKG